METAKGAGSVEAAVTEGDPVRVAVAERDRAIVVRGAVAVTAKGAVGEAMGLGVVREVGWEGVKEGVKEGVVRGAGLQAAVAMEEEGMA